MRGKRETVDPGKPKIPPKADLGLLLHSNAKPLAAIPASAIVQAAEADIRARGHNDARAGQHKPGPKRAYSFFPKHVRAAKDAVDLLRMALENKGDAVTSEDLNVRRIYDNPDRLAEALTLAELRK